ncbi:Hypp5348 [Branchiostoma lanceolatum]|uniref:Hypp5348 protein n=1 Tax=Branchiostoma lanceolatum TaxID=7740 RepID=A0A8K0EZC3_BRALA|nr:Hypp5348 [Branchiostoma lanceolatum]
MERVAEQEFAEEQMCFRKRVGTRDQIFNLRVLMEKTRESNAQLFMAFIDYKKAFDSICSVQLACSKSEPWEVYVVHLPAVGTQALLLNSTTLPAGIQAVEAVQRRAARLTLNDYRQTSSVTQMLNDLQWTLLSERRRNARLTFFYKLVNNYININTDSLLKPAQGRTRGSHTLKFQPLFARTDSYKHSFFPRTIPEWNALPGAVVTAPTVESFRARLEACPP